MSVSELVTIIVTTSPVHHNPCTAMIETTVASCELVPGLADCPKIVVCDGYRVATKAKHKMGVVTPEGAAAYEEYKRRIVTLAGGESSLFPTDDFMASIIDGSFWRYAKDGERVFSREQYETATDPWSSCSGAAQLNEEAVVATDGAAAAAMAPGNRPSAETADDMETNDAAAAAAAADGSPAITATHSGSSEGDARDAESVHRDTVAFVGDSSSAASSSDDASVSGDSGGNDGLGSSPEVEVVGGNDGGGGGGGSSSGGRESGSNGDGGCSSGGGNGCQPALGAFRNTRVMVLPRRQGFGYAVLLGLLKVRTKYVLVVQHDYPWVRGWDIAGLLDAMAAPELDVRCVSVLSTSTMDYERKMLGKYAINIETGLKRHGRFRLLPLLFWYDKPHVCDTEHYRNLVFGRPWHVRRGQFIEDTFGQAMLADIKANGLAAHAKYAAYVADDGAGVAAVGHLHGRGGRSRLYALAVTPIKAQSGGGGDGGGSSGGGGSSQAAAAPDADLAARQPLWGEGWGTPGRWDGPVARDLRRQAIAEAAAVAAAAAAASSEGEEEGALEGHSCGGGEDCESGAEQ